jgi:hypothetical protein
MLAGKTGAYLSEASWQYAPLINLYFLDVYGFSPLKRQLLF